MWGNVAKNQSDSIGLIKTGASVETNAQLQMAAFSKSVVDDVIQGADNATQANAVAIVRGAKGDFDLQSQQLSVRIKDWLNGFRKYYKDVGFTEKELLDFYFPRQFNFKLINASKENQAEFVNLVTQAFENITKTASKKNPVILGSKNITTKVGNKTVTKTVDNKITSPLKGEKSKEFANNYLRSITDSQDEIVKFALAESGRTSELINYAGIRLPISKHVEYERVLKGAYEDVEKVLEKYLINDVGTVLTSLARESVQSVEFARVFGPRGEVLQTILKRLRKQYKDQGFEKSPLGGYGSYYVDDVTAIKNAINSYFGRYGATGSPNSRAMTAILSSMANFQMMDKVTLANIGDLIQPFQNSRHIWSAIQGLKSAVPFKENKKYSYIIDYIY